VTWAAVRLVAVDRVEELEAMPVRFSSKVTAPAGASLSLLVTDTSAALRVL